MGWIIIFFVIFIIIILILCISVKTGSGREELIKQYEKLRTYVPKQKTLNLMSQHAKRQNWWDKRRYMTPELVNKYCSVQLYFAIQCPYSLELSSTQFSRETVMETIYKMFTVLNDKIERHITIKYKSSASFVFGTVIDELYVVIQEFISENIVPESELDAIEIVKNYDALDKCDTGAIEFLMDKSDKVYMNSNFYEPFNYLSKTIDISIIMPTVTNPFGVYFI